MSRDCGAARAVALALAAAVVPSAMAADADADLLAQGRALFLQGAVPPCAVCHTLKDAGATGAIGPVLDELQPGPERVLSAMRNGIGLMPSFKTTLDDAQMRALARYVSKASGGAK